MCRERREGETWVFGGLFWGLNPPLIYVGLYVNSYSVCVRARSSKGERAPELRPHRVTGSEARSLSLPPPQFRHRTLHPRSDPGIAPLRFQGPGGSKRLVLYSTIHKILAPKRTAPRPSNLNKNETLALRKPVLGPSCIEKWDEECRRDNRHASRLGSGGWLGNNSTLRESKECPSNDVSNCFVCYSS